MILHRELSDSELRSKIRKNNIYYGGNRKLRIYGVLSCMTGKRMKRENRIFFVTENEAVKNGYRPCGHCMKEKYKAWKNGIV